MCINMRINIYKTLAEIKHQKEKKYMLENYCYMQKKKKA